jgi:iron-sulfur cluster assembly protein
MITISNEALSNLKEVMKEEGIDINTHFLRVGVKGGGCSGLSYVMDFDDTKTESDEMVTVGGELKVLIDKKSLLYLIGTELQYTSGLNGKGFEWINPNASRSCGCGSSFSV